MAELRRLAERGPFRAKALDPLGIPRAYLDRLVRSGHLVRLDRGLYRTRFVDPEAADLVELAAVQARVPTGSFCLLSAAGFHELGIRRSRAHWLMIGTHDRRPTIDCWQIELVRAGGRARAHGVHTFKTMAGELRVSSPAKTVAECLRYRRRLGDGVAQRVLAAFLGAVRRQRKAGRMADQDFTLNALHEAAAACRVATVLRAFLRELDDGTGRAHRRGR